VNRIRAASAAVVLVVAGGLASGCTDSGTSASDDPPLPTIGLGADFDAETIPSGLVAENADEIDSIVMIGDSITVASTPALEAQFAEMGFDDTVIEAVVGKRMAMSSPENPSGVKVASFITGADSADPDGQLWIVALGTNDINQYTPDELAAAVNEMLAAVPDDVPLIWVDTSYRDEAEGAALMNAIIGDRLSRRGNSVMAPWAAFASADGLVRSDGVHPTEAGTLVFADVVGATIDEFLERSS
jgi:lysophospholipase L1-like esterase